MTEHDKKVWKQIIDMIKKDYAHVAITYSSADGWANICYKKSLDHITIGMGWPKIASLLYSKYTK